MCDERCPTSRRRGLRKLVALAVVLAASLVAVAPAAAQEGSGITGYLTDVSETTVLVEENPDEQYGSGKASVEITAETTISRQQGQDLVSVTPDDLEAGQRVEVAFSGPVAESYPVQATAASVTILEDTNSGATTTVPGLSDELPDTGGAVIVVGVCTLLGGVLLAARWISG